jgi:peptide/nickel transport system permease protein
VSEGRVTKEHSKEVRALRRVLRTKVTLIGLVIVLFLTTLALIADVLPLQDPNVMNSKALRMPPGTPEHPFGTDAFGRDVLSRVVYGTRTSLFISFAVVGLSSVIGSLLGAIVGYVGGFVDSLVSRIWDVLFSFPGIVLFLVIMGTLGPGVQMAIIAITVGSIPGFGRLMRERVLSQRARGYVEAAQAIGARTWHIMFKHVLPNSLTSVLVQGALSIPGVIIAEAGLSYLGLGVPPPHPSWGKMIAEGQDLLEVAPWISLIPGFFILLATLGFNLVGDGLRDFFDPTQLR